MAAAATAWMVAGQPVGTQRGPVARGTEIIDGHAAVAGEVLVRFKGERTSSERSQLEAQLDAEESEPIAPSSRRIRSRSLNTRSLVAYLRTRQDIDVAEPNYVLSAEALPNDPYVGSLWGLRNAGQTVNGDPGTAGKDIHAASAWEVTTGSRANVVAVIDTGVDYNHPDLAANMWSAPSSFTVTINGVTITCAAGTHGYNAIKNTCDPMDDNNHGTHVAGTIGGVGGNGLGVVGVNWTASIMGAKFLSSTGSGYLSDAIKAIEFTIQARKALGAAANVRVLSNSWGGGGYSTLLRDEIAKAQTNDMLFVAAAGNAAQNTDVTPSYPASYDVPNVVAVAATDNDDFLASFSNYGVSSVDLAAPGVNIRSTIRGSSYAHYNGTSMATPHVSGAAALVLAACPSLTTPALKDVLLNHGIEPVGGLVTRVATGGRLDVDSAVRYCSAPPAPSAPSVPSSLTATPGDGAVALAWVASNGATSYQVLRGTESAAYDATPIATNVTATTYVDSAVVNGVTYHYAVVAVNDAGQSAPSADIAAQPAAPIVEPLAPPSTPTGVKATGGSNKVQLSWTASDRAVSYTVKSSSSATGVYSTVATGITATSYTHTGLSRKKLYYYVVVAVNEAGESPSSSPVSAVTR